MRWFLLGRTKAFFLVYYSKKIHNLIYKNNCTFKIILKEQLYSQNNFHPHKRKTYNKFYLLIRNSSFYCQLLVYAHLDISEPDMSKWETNPYELVEKDKTLFGKGVTYGKGSLLCWFHAIQTYRHFKRPLPIKIKFIVESMHERNHAGLEAFLHTKKRGFLATVDYIVVNESEWLGTRMPCLSYGTVGKVH